ncbi:MAG: uracil-DNA glycosylase, partial [Burkholderiales bacterium]
MIKQLLKSPIWQDQLTHEFEQLYFRQLSAFVESEYQQAVVYPAKEQIFYAFERCCLEQVQVLILGQDPYHAPKQAHGLCFSVPEGVKIPPSLRNVFQEIQQDVGGPLPKSGNLERWAQQGVLLLNSILTVR